MSSFMSPLTLLLLKLDLYRVVYIKFNFYNITFNFYYINIYKNIITGIFTKSVLNFPPPFSVLFVLSVSIQN